MKRSICISGLFFAILMGVLSIALTSNEVITFTEQAKAEYGSCEEHTYTSPYEVISEGNCKSTGLKYRKCDVCGFIDYVTIPKNPDRHERVSSNWTYDPMPTCQNGGTRFHICFDCNEKVDYAELEADPNAHIAAGGLVEVLKPTCLTKGYEAYQCKLCNSYFDGKETEIDPNSHLVTDWSVKKTIKTPTCYEEGQAECYCDLCGYLAWIEPIPRTDDHTWSGDRVVDAQPTCTTAGSSSVHCIYCDAKTAVEEIPVVPENHLYSEERTTDKKPTCISVGQESYHCVYCDALCDITEIPVDDNAHEYGDEWIVTREPSCSLSGIKHTVCRLCGQNSQDVMIPKLAHTYGSEYETLDVSADGLSAKVKYTCLVCGYENIVIKTFGTGTDDPVIDPVEPYFLKLTESSIFVSDDEKMNISNVVCRLSIADFYKNFKNGVSFVLYNAEGDYASDSGYVGTGYHMYYESVDGVVSDYTVSVTGDVNSDGLITAQDARLVLRAVAGLELFDEEYRIAADVDMSGKMTASDARSILRVAAGLEFFESTYGNWGS